MKVIIEGAAIFPGTEEEEPSEEEVIVLGADNEDVPSGCVHLVFPSVTLEFGAHELARALLPFLKNFEFG